MTKLDHEKLIALESEFSSNKEGIALPNFIWLMRTSISHPESDKYELVNGLIKLFQDIDINGDKHIEWEEFTQYIIDAVISENNINALEEKEEKNESVPQNAKQEQSDAKKLLIKEAYAKAKKSYRLRYELSEKVGFHHYLQSFVPAPRFNSYYVIEEDSDRMHCLGDNLCLKETIELPTAGNSVVRNVQVIVFAMAVDTYLGYVTHSLTLARLHHKR